MTSAAPANLAIYLQLIEQHDLVEYRFAGGPEPVPPSRVLVRFDDDANVHESGFYKPDGQLPRRLRDDVATLCASLELLPPDASVTATDVTFDDGRSIAVWETPAHELLAVILALDDRMISEAMRRARWGP